MRVLLSIVFIFLLLYSKKIEKIHLSNYHIYTIDVLALFLYICAVLVLTIGVRLYDNKSYIILDPIRAYKVIIDTLIEGIKNNAFIEHFRWVQEALEDYALNILLFVPFGYLLSYVIRKHNQSLLVILAGYLFSLFIEMIQLITHFGWFDATDIIHNTIGSFVGYKIYTIIERR